MHGYVDTDRSFVGAGRAAAPTDNSVPRFDVKRETWGLV